MKDDGRQHGLFANGFIDAVTIEEAIGDLPEIPANSEVWIRRKPDDCTKIHGNRYLDLSE